MKLDRLGDVTRLRRDWVVEVEAFTLGNWLFWTGPHTSYRAARKMVQRAGCPGHRYRARNASGAWTETRHIVLRKNEMAT